MTTFLSNVIHVHDAELTADKPLIAAAEPPGRHQPGAPTARASSTDTPFPRSTGAGRQQHPAHPAPRPPSGGPPSGDAQRAACRLCASVSSSFQSSEAPFGRLGQEAAPVRRPARSRSCERCLVLLAPVSGHGDQVALGSQAPAHAPSCALLLCPRPRPSPGTQRSGANRARSEPSAGPKARAVLGSRGCTAAAAAKGRPPLTASETLGWGLFKMHCLHNRGELQVMCGLLCASHRHSARPEPVVPVGRPRFPEPPRTPMCLPLLECFCTWSRVSWLKNVPWLPSVDPAATLGEGSERGFARRRRDALRQAARFAERMRNRSTQGRLAVIYSQTRQLN